MSPLRCLKFILLLAVFVMSGCKEEEYPANNFERYFQGQWEQVEGPERGVVYDISISPSSSENTGIDFYGQIKTFYLTATDIPLYDKEYSWCVRGVDNHYPLLDLVCKEELDPDDSLSGHYYYKIIKLTDTFMWWQNNTSGDKDVLKFKRRHD